MSIEWNVNDRVANNMPPDGEPTSALQELTEMEMLSVAIGESLTDQLEQQKEKEDNRQTDDQPIGLQLDAACSDIAELQETRKSNVNKCLDDNNNDEAKDETNCTENLSNDTSIETESKHEIEDIKETQDDLERKRNTENAVINNEDNRDGKVDNVQSTAVSSSMHMKLLDKNEKDSFINPAVAIDRRVQGKQQEPFKRQTFPVNYKASTSRCTYSPNKNFNYTENKNRPVMNTSDDRFKNYSSQKPESRPSFANKQFHRTDESKSYRQQQCYFPEESSTSDNYKKPPVQGSSWDPQKKMTSRRSYDTPSGFYSNGNQNYQENANREAVVYRRTAKYNNYNYPKTHARFGDRQPMPPNRNYGTNNSVGYPGPVSKNNLSDEITDETTNAGITQHDIQQAETPVLLDSHSHKGKQPMQLISNSVDESYNNKGKFEDVVNNDPPLINSMNSLQITEKNNSVQFDVNKRNSNEIFVQMSQPPPNISQASNINVDYKSSLARNNAHEYLNVSSNYWAQPDGKVHQMRVAYTPQLVNPYSSVKESSDSVVPSICQSVVPTHMKPPPGFYNPSISRNRWNIPPQEMMYPGPAMAFQSYSPPQLFYMPYACGPSWNPQLAYHTSMMQHPQFNSAMYSHRDVCVNKTKNPPHIQSADNYQRQPDTKQQSYNYHMAYDAFGCDYKQQEYNNPHAGFPTKSEHDNRAIPLNSNQKYSPYPYVTAIDTNFMNQSIYNQTEVCDYKRAGDAQSQSTSGEVDFNQNKSVIEDEPSIPPLISPKDCMNYDNFVPNPQARLSSSFPYRNNAADGQVPQSTMGRGRLRLTNQ